MTAELTPVEASSKGSVIHDYLEYFSASFLAKMNLPGLPGSRAGIYNTANREGWKFIVVPGKGKKDGVRYYRVPDYVHALIIEWREAIKRVEHDKCIEQARVFGDVFGPAAPVRQPVQKEPPDMARLRLAIETVEEGLAVTHRTMKPADKAELVLAVYDLFGESDANKESVVKLVKFAA